VGIPKGFPKSVGSRLHGFPCFPYSVISMACCLPGRCWIQSYVKRRNAPYSPEMFVVIGFRRVHWRFCVKIQKSSGRQGRLPRVIVVHVHTSGELVRLEDAIFRYGKQKSKVS
jgi:hypothetical protein